MALDVNALVQQLQEKANLSQEQAEQAATVALNFVKDQIPQAGDLMEKAGGSEGLAGKIGGLFKRD
ncbi:MAG: hypothetical protein ACRDJ9_05690 [Dehalococcoidia bacterium]